MSGRRIGERSTRSPRSARTTRDQSNRSRSPTPRGLPFNDTERREEHSPSRGREQPTANDAQTPDQLQPGLRPNYQQRYAEARASFDSTGARLRSGRETERPVLPAPPTARAQRADRPAAAPREPLNAITELARLSEALDAGDPSILQHPPTPALWTWAQQVVAASSARNILPGHTLALARMLLSARDRLERFAREVQGQAVAPGAPQLASRSMISAQRSTIERRHQLPPDLAPVLDEPSTNDEPPGLRQTLVRVQDGLAAEDEAVLSDMPSLGMQWWAHGVIQSAQTPAPSEPSLHNLARATLLTLEQLSDFAQRIDAASEAFREPVYGRFELARVKNAVEQASPRLLKDNPPDKMWKWTMDTLRRERAGERISPRLMNLAHEFHQAYGAFKELERLHDARDVLHAHFEQYRNFDAPRTRAASSRMTPQQLITAFVGSEVLPATLNHEVLLEVRRRASKVLTLIGYAEAPEEALPLYHLAAAHMRDFCARQPNNDALRGALTEFRAMWEVTFGDAIAFDPPELPPTRRG